jgi:hypothetical protein
VWWGLFRVWFGLEREIKLKKIKIKIKIKKKRIKSPHTH